jgi:hypothetical protein
MMVKVEFGGWGNCYKLTNGIIDLIITSDVGPRIIYLGFVGSNNLLRTESTQLGKINQEEWMSFGGHRLWHTPEDTRRTYYPDSLPINISENSDIVRITQYVEPTTGIEKSITVQLDKTRALVKLDHKLTNRGIWPIETSAWAITVMAQGGKAILPLPPRGSHPDFLLPTNTIAVWPYTDFSDPRWKFNFRNIFLQQDPEINAPLKIGLFSTDGWLAYINNKELFIKLTQVNPKEKYPDFGSNLEVFTNSKILELESLSPMTLIAPNESINHTEVWYLQQNIPDIVTDRDVDRYIKESIAKL